MLKTTTSADGGAMPADGHQSRRAALGLFASASAFAVTPVAGLAAGLEVDPVFAAIRRHHAAWRAFDASIPGIDNAIARREGRVVTAADEATFTAANKAEEDAFEAFITLPPTTVAGIRAALHYFNELDTDGLRGASDRFLTALLASPVLAGRA
jgi:hypothetical protein